MGFTRADSNAKVEPRGGKHWNAPFVCLVADSIGTKFQSGLAAGSGRAPLGVLQDAGSWRDSRTESQLGPATRPRPCSSLRLRSQGRTMEAHVMYSDVLIIGAGPTGLVLALWLTKLGVKVDVIDKTAE